MENDSAGLEVALAMPEQLRARMFTDRSLDLLRDNTNLLSDDPIADFTSADSEALLSRVEVLITGWGCPRIDASALARMPRLRAIVHTGGTVKGHVTDACWERGITVSSVAAANAVPVAEYTLAMVLLAGKRVLPVARSLRSTRRATVPEVLFPTLGNYEKRIGIIGASKVGRKLIELLRPFNFQVVVSDPYLDPTDAVALGVDLLELDELLATSDIVSLHAPSLPETRHLLDERRIGLIRPGATIINTARGDLIDQEALNTRISGGDLHAILDVTTPWVLEADNPLYDQPNVFLTPHMAGSLGVELRRLAAAAIDEALRFASGREFASPVRMTDLAFTA